MRSRPVEIEYLLKDGVSPGLSKIERNATAMGRTVEREGARAGSAFQKMILPAGAAIAMRQFGRSIEEVYADMQMLESSFEVLLSGKGVPAFVDALKEFAVDSPLSLTGVSNAAQTLLGFNVETERVIPIIRQLGDVSMGNEERFRSLALVYAQVHSAGKLMGQDLIQMINAGFNPLQYIAEKTGKEIGVLKKEMEEGAISAQMVADAFISATSEGGKFYGMTQKQADGIKGLKAQFEGAMQEMQSSIGENNEAIIAGSYKASIAVVENYEKVGKILLGLIATYGAYRAAVIVATTVEKGWTIAQLSHFKALVVVEKAQKLLNATMLSNPYVLAATLLVGLVATMWALHDSTTAAERAQEWLNKRQEEFNEQEQNRRARIDELVRIIQDETQTLYAQITAYEELKKISPALTDAYSREALAVAELTEANKVLNAEQDKRNADKLISDIDSTRNKILELKKELESLRNAQSTAGNVGFAFQIAKMADEIKVQENMLAGFRKNLADHNRRVAEAEFNALPPAEKIKIKEEQLEKIRSEFDRVNSVINEEMAKLPQEVQIPVWFDLGEQPQNFPSFSLPSPRGVLTPLNMAQARADALRSEEAATQAELDAMKAANNTKKELTEEEKKRLADEAKRRREQAQKDAEALAKLEAQFADAVAQARIDAMEDGLQKTLAQNELNFNREKAQIEQQEKELLEARKKTLKADQTATLTVQEQDGFNRQRETAEIERRRADAAARQAEADRLNAMLKDYQTYQQRATEIAKKYAQERTNVTAAGGGEENIALVNQAEQEAVDALNLEYAQKESTFRAWMNQLATQTLDELTRTLAEAQAALAEAEAAGATGQALAAAKSRVAQAKMAIEAESEKATKETDASGQIKSWQKLYATLKDVSNEFEEIGDSVGGIAGEIIKTAGTIAGETIQIINGITTLVDTSAQAMVATSATASAAIKAVEKASVILAIIGAVIKVVTVITGLFKDNEEQLRAATDAAYEYNRAMEEISRSQRLSLFDTIFGTDGIGKFQEAKDIAIESLRKIWDEVQTFRTQANKSWMPTEELRKKWGYLDEYHITATYDGRSAWNKFFDTGSHKVKTYYFDINDYINTDGSLKLEELQNWYEQFENGLDDAERQILQDLIANGEAYEEAMQVMVDHIDELWGDLATSIADNMLNSYLKIGDAAGNLRDIVDDAGRDMARSMIKSLLISGDADLGIEAIFGDKLKGQLLELLKLGDRQGANALIQDAIASAGELAPIIEGIITSLGLTSEAVEKGISQSGKAGTIQTMSQDMGTEIKGLFTAMRMGQEETNKMMEELGPGLTEATGVLVEIRDEVKKSNGWLDKIYTKIESAIRDGIKVK